MNGHQKQREESGRMIENALFELMEEKQYAGITVTEIVRRADVSRRTFYRLYKEKDKVLREYFHKLCGEYCDKNPALSYYDVGKIALDYFRFWYQYKEFLLLMHKSGMDEMLYYEMSRASADVVKKRMERNGTENTEGIEYFADYSAGGFIRLLQRWIMTGMQETPEQYAGSVSEALQKFIRPSFRG